MYYPDLKPYSTRLPTSLMKQVKLYCVQTEKSVQNFIIEAVEKKLQEETSQEKA